MLSHQGGHHHHQQQPSQSQQPGTAYAPNAPTGYGQQVPPPTLAGSQPQAGYGQSFNSSDPSLNQHHHTSYQQQHTHGSHTGTGSFDFKSVVVTVVEARNLTDRDLVGQSDPYIIVHSGSHHKKSRAHKNAGENPLFNERFELPVSHGTQELVVEIYDKDTLSRDDLMGKVIVNLSELQEGGTVDHWFTVLNKHDQPSGEMRLSMYPQGSTSGKIHDALHGHGHSNPLGKLKEVFHKS